VTASSSNGGFGETALPGRARSPSAPSCEPCGGFGETALPVRKYLPHAIPPWTAVGSVYFITINCAPRGVNQLADSDIADAVEASFLHYQNTSKWWIHFLLLMPDHLHGLISFGRDVAMRRVVADWKRFLARERGIKWQRDFFDHRIRDDESLTEKWHYIRNNPVRKQLVSEPDDWPYQWHNGQPCGTRNTGGFGYIPYPESPDHGSGAKRQTALPGRARSPSAPSTPSNDELKKEES